MFRGLKRIETSQIVSEKKILLIKEILVIACGSLFMAMLSQVKIQLGLIPMTLQTLGVFMLGFALGPRRAFLSIIVYLGEATCGQPVLAGGGCDPLWIFTPKGGFLIGFPFAAYAVGYFMKQKYKYGLLQAALATFFAQGIIYFFGIAWLSYFLGLKKAFVVGVVPFFSVMLIKVFLAIVLSKPLLYFSRKLK